MCFFFSGVTRVLRALVTTWEADDPGVFGSHMGKTFVEFSHYGEKISFFAGIGFTALAVMCCVLARGKDYERLSAAAQSLSGVSARAKIETETAAAKATVRCLYCGTSRADEKLISCPNCGAGYV
jgi:hypothetical protein